MPTKSGPQPRAGRGQVIKRVSKSGEASYLVRVPNGRNANGSRKYLSQTVYTRKDADKLLTKWLRDTDQGLVIEPSAITLNTYLDKWLEAARPRLGARTYSDYVKDSARYIRPTLGQRRLDQIKPLDVQTLYGGLEQRGLGANTIRRVHATLSGALGQAVKWQMLPYNPAKGAQRPKVKRKEMQALDVAQAQTFRQAAAETRWGALFTFALSTGMRPGEYLALRWQDVDWQGGAVRVQQALVQADGRWQFGEPKTPQSRRTIPLPPSLTVLLREHQKQQAEERLACGPDYASHGLVFANARGEPLDQHNLIARHFKPLLKRAGLPSIRLYDLRHTCATLLLLAGENVKVVSERLGHASIVLTLDVYSHVLKSQKQGAADRMESLLWGGQDAVAVAHME
jgi:integrase